MSIPKLNHLKLIFLKHNSLNPECRYYCIMVSNIVHYSSHHKPKTAFRRFLILPTLTQVIHFCYTISMSTTKSRINISLSDETRKALMSLAYRDNIPEATKAARLLELALEIEEDQIWNQIAENRDKYKGRYFSHKQAWK